MTSVRVLYRDYAITPTYLANIAGEFSGYKLIMSESTSESVEFTFERAKDAQEFRQVLDTCFSRRAA